MPKSETHPTRFYLDDEEHAPKNPKHKLEVPAPNPNGNLIVWVTYDGTYIGDFNNEIAIAKALNPKEIKVILNVFEAIPFDKEWVNDMVTKDGMDFTSQSIFEFVDPIDQRRYYEQAAACNIPDVIINTKHRVLFSHIASEEAMPELKKAITVRVDLPDMKDDGVIKDCSHLNAVFSHRIDPDVKLKANAQLFELTPTKVTPRMVDEAALAAPKEYDRFKTASAKPVYTALIGERVDANVNLGVEDIKTLADKLIDTIKTTGGSLLVATAPRTHPEVSATLRETLKLKLPAGIEFAFYDYKENRGKNNMFHAFIGMADKVVFTEDSMSMASDVIASGKQAFVSERRPQIIDSSKFTPKELAIVNETDNVHKKHLSVIKENNYAHSIDDLAKDMPPTTIHNSAYDIAKAIKQKLKLRDAQKTSTSTIIDGIKATAEASLGMISWAQKACGITPTR